MCGQAKVVLPLFLGLKDPSIHCGLGSEDVRPGSGGGGRGGGGGVGVMQEERTIATSYRHGLLYVCQHFSLMLSTKTQTLEICSLLRISL